MKIRRVLIYALRGYEHVPDISNRDTLIAVTDKLVAVCDELLKKDESLVLRQHSLMGAAGHDFSFRETCRIEELPALMFYDRLPLEMVIAMLERSIEEIDLTEFDILWSETPFKIEWKESGCVTSPAREAFEEYVFTFGLPGTWTCEWEGDPHISVSRNGCLFLINFTEVLEWSDGDLLIPRNKS